MVRIAHSVILALLLVLGGCIIVPGPGMVISDGHIAQPAIEVTGVTPGSAVLQQYPTVYPRAPFDDPTLVILLNTSYRATLWASLDGQQEITLRPQMATGDLHVDFGDHTIRVRGEVPTYFGTKPIPEQVIRFRADLYRRSPVIYLRE